MIHIALGVCLGIVAAVYLLNWLGRLAEWRAERRERRAYAKMLRAYEMTADQRQDQEIDRFVGVIVYLIIATLVVLPLIGGLLH